MVSQSVPNWGAAYLAEDEHSGPTPRGRGASAAAIGMVTRLESSIISSGHIVDTVKTGLRSPRTFVAVGSSDKMSLQFEGNRLFRASVLCPHRPSYDWTRRDHGDL